jgi:hypothetical protein
MSAPIPIIKKEENTGGYFASWFKKQKNKENIEEEIFEMDDDELPPKLTPNPPLEKDLDDVDDSENELGNDISQDELCFGFPCSNNKYYGFCKKCEEDSICTLIVESVQQGFNDMRSDIQGLWKNDAVKIWTAFLTVCYFNIPNEAMFCTGFYLLTKKLEQEEKNLIDRELNNEENEENEEEIEEETKKCV